MEPAERQMKHSCIRIVSFIEGTFELIYLSWKPGTPSSDLPQVRPPFQGPDTLRATRLLKVTKGGEIVLRVPNGPFDLSSIPVDRHLTQTGDPLMTKKKRCTLCPTRFSFYPGPFTSALNFDPYLLMTIIRLYYIDVILTSL